MDAEIKTYYERESGASLTDSLTGAFNHGFFQTLLEREIKRSQRYGSSFCLALVDIDSFSAFNKSHGPAQGDRMLKEIAALTMKNIRQVDLAARYSGDVLAILTMESDTQSAMVVLERIRQAVEKMSGGDLTLSGGLASFPQHGADGESLLQKAQEALDLAKVRGKNRICVFQNESKPTSDEVPNILVVDDVQRNVRLLEALLQPLNYNVLKAFNGENALSIVRDVNPDLVLLDIMMPGIDGYEVCRRLKENKDTRLIPVVMVTALDDIEAKVKAIEAGADDFVTKPPNKIELLTRIKSLLKVKSLNNSLTSIENIVISFANAVEAKDAYTQGHVERLSNLARAIGQKMGLSAREIGALRCGGVLHDIGKIGISEAILNKPGPLNPEEWKVMKGHTDAGEKICLPLKKNLGRALKVVRHHHEKLDGSGYPDGLKGEEVSIEARIMAVVDIYDALVTARPYRKAMGRKAAFEILHQEAREGKLDKKVVELLMEIIG